MASKPPHSTNMKQFDT